MFDNIPKVIHFYWDGSKMPFFCFYSALSFRIFNPEWKIKIYSPKVKSTNKPWQTNEQKTEYQGKNYFDELKKIQNIDFIIFDFESISIPNEISEIQKSDFLRWHLLSTEGGVWSDFDIIYFKGINEIQMQNQLVTQKKQIDFSVCYDFNTPHIYKYSIGFLFSKKECSFYKKIFEKAIEQFDQTDYQGAGSQILNFNYPYFELLHNSEKHSNIWNTSMDIVYAYSSHDINLIYSSNDLKKFTQNSIGLHFYYGSDITKKIIKMFENKIIIDNVLMRVINQVHFNARLI